MLDVATRLQLCRITSATLVSQEYHKTIQTSRGSEAVLQKKYRYFKNSPHFYRNPSVTNSPKTLQLCCASSQNQPSVTDSAHFWGHSSAFCFVYFCIYMYLYALICIIGFLCTLLWRHTVFPSLLLSHGKQIGAAVQYPAQQLHHKKRPLHKNVQRPLTIQAMLLNDAQEQAITEQPLLPRSA